MLSQDPGAEEIIMHGIKSYDYICFRCKLNMGVVSKNKYKCSKCGLTYAEGA